MDSDEKRPTRRKMPQFPAFEVSASYEEYAARGVSAGAIPAHETASDKARRNVSGTRAGKADAADATGVAVGEFGEADVAEAARRSFERQVDAVITCVGSQNALREVLYKTLVHCEQPRDFAEVEDFVSSQDEYVYSHIVQTPFTLVQMLLRCEGLSQKALDAEGLEVTDERCEGLSEDEVDDLVATYELETTPAGAAAASLVSPTRRLEAQLAQKPHRRATYYALMEFCQEPRTFPEIQEFFKTTPDLALDTVQVHHTLSPDFYVDKLDKAGVLVWQGAWVINDAGRKALAASKDADSPLDE